MKRTFFVADIGKNPPGLPYLPTSVHSRHTCDDIRDELAFEKADARMAGGKFSFTDLLTKFPQAAQAGGVYATMMQAVARSSYLRGPYIISTEHEPSNEELVAWFDGVSTGNVSERVAHEEAALVPVLRHDSGNVTRVEDIAQAAIAVDRWGMVQPYQHKDPLPPKKGRRK